MNQQRNSSVELFRILSMLLIIGSHFCVHSGFAPSEMSFSFNKVLLQAGVLGNLGVVNFVMISGYFLSKSKFKLSRVVKIVLQVVFYSVVIFCVLAGLNIIDFSKKDLIKAMLPILFERYWFASAYVILCVLSPFINIMLNSFTKKQHTYFLVTLLIIWGVIPTLTNQMLFSNELWQFLFFYSIGAFVREYPDMSFSVRYRYLIVGICLFLLIGSSVLIDLLPIKIPVFENGYYFYTRSSVFIIGLSYGLLLIFVNLKSKSNKTINIISSATFGIYLIHDNRYLRDLIWKDLFNTKIYENSSYLGFYLIFCVAAVFVTCGVIDYVRQKLLEKPLMHILENPLNRLTARVDKAVETNE